MAGRETGTPGGTAAAEYLAAELARLGLRPAGVELFDTLQDALAVRRLLVERNQAADPA